MWREFLLDTESSSNVHSQRCCCPGGRGIRCHHIALLVDFPSWESKTSIVVTVSAFLRRSSQQQSSLQIQLHRSSASIITTCNRDTGVATRTQEVILCRGSCPA